MKLLLFPPSKPQCCVYIFFYFSSFFLNESTAIYLLPYCCTVKSRCPEQTGGFREIMVPVGRVLVWMHEEDTVVPPKFPDGCLYLFWLSDSRHALAVAGPHCRCGTFRVLSSFSEVRQRTGGVGKAEKKTKSSAFIFLSLLVLLFGDRRVILSDFQG